MSTTAITSRTAAAEHVSLGVVLGERNIWLLFVLGFGAGFPAASVWINLFPRVDLDIDKALLLTLGGFGVAGWLGLIASPFLDRHHAPLFGSFGHRKSWLAAVLAVGLVVIALHLGTAAVSQVAAMRFAAFSGVLALLVWAPLWICLDALRIDLYRGRSQAAAITAQYFGALAASTVATLPMRDWHYLAPAIFCALLFAIGLGAVLRVREPPPVSAADDACAPSFLGTLARPWSTFFTRHGKASAFLLGALAFYALAASAADLLGREGYLVDILRAARWQDSDPDNDRALRAIGTQEIALTAVGALAGLFIAFKLQPERAFNVLLYAIIGMLALFALCRAWAGFTVFTVAGLFALRTLIYGALSVIFATVAARLTARPDTAGHFALLTLFSSLFWISESGFAMLAPLVGSYAMTAAAAVAAIAAIVLMRLASRAAKRAAAIDRG